MSETKSDRVHELWYNSARKFDYYITGLSVALVAYWGKLLSPTTNFVSRESLLALGLLVLLVSIYLGLRRMEKDIEATASNFRYLFLAEQAEVLESASAQSTLLHDVTQGSIQTPAQVKQRAGKFRSASKHAEDKTADLGRVSQKLYKWRNRALGFGLLLAIASRLWPTN